MKYEKIDYSKLHDHIITKAFERAGLVLTPEDRQKLIQGKIERAKIEIATRRKFAATSQY